VALILGLGSGSPTTIDIHDINFVFLTLCYVIQILSNVLSVDMSDSIFWLFLWPIDFHVQWKIFELRFRSVTPELNLNARQKRVAKYIAQGMNVLYMRE
jgi:hypothetical protein